jgi:hypothetical protein
MSTYYYDLARVIQEEREARASRARLAAELPRTVRPGAVSKRGGKPRWLRIALHARPRLALAH